RTLLALLDRIFKRFGNSILNSFAGITRVGLNRLRRCAKRISQVRNLFVSRSVNWVKCLLSVLYDTIGHLLRSLVRLLGILRHAQSEALDYEVANLVEFPRW